MRRFRLISLLVAMLTASVVLWFNTQGRWVDSGQQPYFAYFGTWEIGWPWNAISHEAFLFHWKEYKESLGQKSEVDFEKGFVEEARNSPRYPYLRPVDHPRGTILIKKQQQLHWGHIALNTFVALAMSVAALFACEFLVGRRENRAKPEARV